MFTLLAAAAIAICPAPPAQRITCVHDGDTFWWQGEKIRIADIDTPELNGKCAAERQLAIKARGRLVQLLRNGGFRIERNGKDRYGRTLARLRTAKGTIGEQLVSEGLAKRWGNRSSWC